MRLSAFIAQGGLWEGFGRWKTDVEALAAFRTSDDESGQQDRRSVEGGEHLHAFTS
jgi:hypothetical protein